MKRNKLASIAIGLVAVASAHSCATSKNKGQMNSMVARMEVKEPISGVCDQANVFAILPLPGNGQIKAKAPRTREEISAELNAKVAFLKDKPDYEDQGMVNLVINCKGELVRCQIDNKTKSPELDAQVVAVFAELKAWSPGTINNRAVDTVVLYRFTITNGKITVA